MAKQKRWTKEEEQVVIDCLNKYPGNNTYCFMIASNKINRSVTAITARYRLKKAEWDHRVILTPTGVRTQYGVLRFIKENPPVFVKIKNAVTIIKIVFKGVK